MFLFGVQKMINVSPKQHKLKFYIHEVYVSSASIWEATIKIKLKKLDVDVDELVEAITESGFLELPITAHHAAAVNHLSEIHRDLFDPILIAQAIFEPLTFLTAGAVLRNYSELIEVI